MPTFGDPANCRPAAREAGERAIALHVAIDAVQHEDLKHHVQAII